MSVPWMFACVQSWLCLRKSTTSSLVFLALSWRWFRWHQSTKSKVSLSLSLIIYQSLIINTHFCWYFCASLSVIVVFFSIDTININRYKYELNVLPWSKTHQQQLLKPPRVLFIHSLHLLGFPCHSGASDGQLSCQQLTFPTFELSSHGLFRDCL